MLIRVCRFCCFLSKDELKALILEFNQQGERCVLMPILSQYRCDNVTNFLATVTTSGRILC